MLVPSLPLIRLTAAVLLPAAAVAGFVPGTSGLALTLVLIFGVVVAWDAWQGWDQLDDLELTLPPVLRFTQDRNDAIRIRLRTANPRARLLHAALALPDAVESMDQIRSLILTDTAEPVEFTWPVIPRKRGRHSLPAVHVETPSPYGLWAVRRVLAQDTQVQVYPDLFQDRRATAAVFLDRAGAGIHAQRQVGQGREFEKLRDYGPQDPVSDIHWKATAKRGRPVTKVFQIERTQELYVILDASRLSGRVTDGEPDWERSLRAGLLLAAAAERQGDLFGAVAFDSQVRCWVRSRRGRSHFAACREALFALHPQTVTPDFAEVCTTLRLRLGRRALLLFITALDDPVLAEDFTRSIGLLSRQHLVLVVQARPSGARPLFTPTDLTAPDEVYGALGGHVRWQKLRLLEQTLRLQNVRFTLADPDALGVTVIRQYFEVRQRQLQ